MYFTCYVALLSWSVAFYLFSILNWGLFMYFRLFFVNFLYVVISSVASAVDYNRNPRLWNYWLCVAIDIKFGSLLNSYPPLCFYFLTITTRLIFNAIMLTIHSICFKWFKSFLMFWHYSYFHFGALSFRHIFAQFQFVQLVLVYSAFISFHSHYIVDWVQSTTQILLHIVCFWHNFAAYNSTSYCMLSGYNTDFWFWLFFWYQLT